MLDPLDAAGVYRGRDGTLRTVLWGPTRRQKKVVWPYGDSGIVQDWASYTSVNYKRAFAKCKVGVHSTTWKKFEAWATRKLPDDTVSAIAGWKESGTVQREACGRCGYIGLLAVWRDSRWIAMCPDCGLVDEDPEETE